MNYTNPSSSRITISSQDTKVFFSLTHQVALRRIQKSEVTAPLTEVQNRKSWAKSIGCQYFDNLQVGYKLFHASERS